MVYKLLKKIVSGGQTGVDRAALDCAIKFNIAHGGWCPYGRQAEDGIIPEYYNLKEAPGLTFEENLDQNIIYKKRTELNVHDSDGTLIIINHAPIGGTLYTFNMVEKYQKPYFIINISVNYKINNIADWIIQNNISILNVAGPRESQMPGIYHISYNILDRLLNNKR